MILKEDLIWSFMPRHFRGRLLSLFIILRTCACASEISVNRGPFEKYRLISSICFRWGAVSMMHKDGQSKTLPSRALRINDGLLNPFSIPVGQTWFARLQLAFGHWPFGDTRTLVFGNCILVKIVLVVDLCIGQTGRMEANCNSKQQLA